MLCSNWIPRSGLLRRSRGQLPIWRESPCHSAYSLLLVPLLCCLPSHFQLNSQRNRASKLVRVVFASSPTKEMTGVTPDAVTNVSTATKVSTATDVSTATKVSTATDVSTATKVSTVTKVSAAATMSGERRGCKTVTICEPLPSVVEKTVTRRECD